ncbi:MAG TPA: methyltransferase domain-containing protein [Kofleriaceae bacterium]|nr:methyltransferase domain-containing protein [Kofleriaceae bacterium]
MDPRALYGDAYSEVYRELYVRHPMWRDKHELNLRIVRSLLAPGGSWLDTCCGQAWHFTEVPGGARTGIDVSAAQLSHARRDNPGATFLEGDVLDVALDARFDLVTNFWGAYSYLDDHARIAAFVRRAIAWTAPGGALYLELITPDTLAAFNATAFAADTGSAVRLRSADGVAWSYRDPGGWHDLTSPPAAFFEELLAPHFRSVEPRGVAATLVQLVAADRQRSEP